VKNNVPFDVAFAMPEHMRFAAAVVMSEHEGAEFDWNTLAFKDPPRP
jgi:hypothetical protein